MHWVLGEFTVTDLSKILGTYGQILGAAVAAVSFSQPDWDRTRCVRLIVISTALSFSSQSLSGVSES